MTASTDTGEHVLRKALEISGQRFTEQRAAVYRFLAGTDSHPTADDVFLQVRSELPGISLATVYKSLETLVGCGLASKLTCGDGCARYDGRTDPHHHVRCLTCGRVSDVPTQESESEMRWLQAAPRGYRVVGYRLLLEGYCDACDGGAPDSATSGPARA